MSNNTLIHLLNENIVNWESVERRLQSHPEECKGEEDKEDKKKVVKSINNDNNSTIRRKRRYNCYCPLLLSISKKAPTHIIKRIILLNPNAVKKVQRTTGLTPLDLAVSTKGIHPDIIQLLLKIKPNFACKSSFNGCIPLHAVRNIQTAKYLLRAYPKGVIHTNDQGYLPIHRATYSPSVSPDVVELLLKEGKKHHLNKGGVFSKTSSCVGSITPFAAICDVICNNKNKQQQQPLKDDVDDISWEKFCHIAHAAIEEEDDDKNNNDSRNSTFKILHASVNLCCPDSIIRIALNKYPQQCFEYDNLGRSALSCAVMKEETSTEVIQLLLRMNPSAASKFDEMITKKGRSTCSTHQRRMPLHHIIVSGRPYGNGLMSIIKADPRAIEVRDKYDTGLYPFMLAAASTRSKNTTPDLTTIYTLLRQAPHLSTPSFQDWNSTKEKYNKINQTEEKFVLLTISIAIVIVAIVMHALLLRQFTDKSNVDFVTTL